MKLPYTLPEWTANLNAIDPRNPYKLRLNLLYERSRTYPPRPLDMAADKTPPGLRLLQKGLTEDLNHAIRCIYTPEVEITIRRALSKIRAIENLA